MSQNFNRSGEGYESQDQSPKVVPINPDSSASFKKNSFNLRDAARNAIKNDLIDKMGGWNLTHFFTSTV
jgi:hypothetical protein